MNKQASNVQRKTLDPLEQNIKKWRWLESFAQFCLYNYYIGGAHIEHSVSNSEGDQSWPPIVFRISMMNSNWEQRSPTYLAGWKQGGNELKDKG